MPSRHFFPFYSESTYSILHHGCSIIITETFYIYEFFSSTIRKEAVDFYVGEVKAARGYAKARRQRDGASPCQPCLNPPFHILCGLPKKLISPLRKRTC